MDQNAVEPPGGWVPTRSINRGKGRPTRGSAIRTQKRGTAR